MMFYEELKIFVIYKVTLKALQIFIYLLKIAYIIGNNLMQVASLKQDKVSIKILIKYLNFSNIFSEKKP